MGSPIRIVAPGTVFHVGARGNNRMKIFRSPADLAFFCRMVAKLKPKFECELYAFCLMSNHFHLLLRGGSQGIIDFMHRLMTAYAKYFNGVYGHTGHVFEDRNWQKPCLDDRYFLALLRYIHRNPVAAGLVTKALDWKYSGHRELVGQLGQGLIDTAFPLACFAEDPEEARREYAAFVDGWKPSENGAQRTLERVCAEYGIAPEEVAYGGARRFTDLRWAAIREAAAGGASVKQIMAAFKCSKATISRACSVEIMQPRPVDSPSQLVLT